MAKCTLIFEDITSPDGKPAVALSGDLGDKEDQMSNAVATAMAVHKLFSTGWLGKNLQKVIPELFITPEEEEKTE